MPREPAQPPTEQGPTRGEPWIGTDDDPADAHATSDWAKAMRVAEELAENVRLGMEFGTSLDGNYDADDMLAVRRALVAAYRPVPTEQGDLAKDLRGAADYLRDHGMAPYYESRVRRAADTLDAHTHSGTAGRVSEEDQARLRKLRDPWMERPARYRPDAEILTRVLAALDPTPDSEAEGEPHDVGFDCLDGGYKGYQAVCWTCGWRGTEFLRGDEEMGTPESRVHKANAKREMIEHRDSTRASQGEGGSR